MSETDGGLLLMTPGPTRVPALVLAAGARPMMHHRSSEFSRELAGLLELIGPVFGTSTTVMPVHTTGRGAMEAILANLLSAGDEIIVCANGRFGELWGKIAGAYGVIVHRVAIDWSKDIGLPELEDALSAHPAVRAVALAATDTSTGVRNDVEAVSRIARRRGVLTFVDGVSAIGGMAFRFDEWQIDAALTASQKCLMSSPGLSFVALSARAWAAAKTATLPKSYWDLSEINSHVSASTPSPAGTPPVHVVLQVAQALRIMHEEGLQAVYKRHADMALRVRAEAARIGVSLQCPGLARYADTVTALAVPGRLSPKIVRDGLKAQGILTAGALGPFESAGFRIGHMGDIRMSDVDRTMKALEGVLRRVAASTGASNA